MKQAKPHVDKHGRRVCGNCARTIKIRHDANHLVCISHLHFVAAAHEAECDDFKSNVADEEAPVVVVKTEP